MRNWVGERRGNERKEKKRKQGKKEEGRKEESEEREDEQISHRGNGCSKEKGGHRTTEESRAGLTAEQ